MSMKEATTSKTYDLWSLFYDYSFGAMVRMRQRRAVEQFHLREGQRVLEIGVGTGLTLHYYPEHVNVVGLDLSGGMLGKAADRCREQKMDNCQLVRADAMLPPFAPQSFDHVMISHTISVVSDPARLLQWASKLLKPNGRIVLLNHFQSTRPLLAWFEHVLNPIFMKVGWRSDLSLEDVLRGVDLSVEYCFQIRTADLWKIVVLRHGQSSSGTDAVAAPAPEPYAPIPPGVVGNS